MAEVFVALGVVLIIVVIVAVLIYKRKKLSISARQRPRVVSEANQAEQRRYGLVKPEDQVQRARRSSARTIDDDPEVFVISQRRQDAVRSTENLSMQPRRARNPPQQRLTDEQIIGLDPPPSYDIAMTETERERSARPR